MMTFDQLLERIFDTSENTKQQGTSFERATVYYLQNDPMYAPMFSDVWLWNDSPTCTGQDIGIDVVARDANDGTYWAIQCKCYQEDATLSYGQLSTFFATAAAQGTYAHYMIVDTANTWTSHLLEIAQQYGAVRVSADNLREAELDWEPFVQGKPRAERTIYEARKHQKDAIEKVLAGFKHADRGKLIMACGTGKTLTALRLVEEYCPQGTVLFLAPSISLVSQTLRSWASQSKNTLRPFVVCSDTKASNVEDIWDTSVSEIPFPATTDPEDLARQIKATSHEGDLTVVFSTYQSIQVVIDAQAQGLPEFDLCICDEAHRTTGVRDTSLSTEEQSAFTKVHDANMLKAAKRLYMTATPRIYSTNAVKKAHEESYEVASMDDVTKYGEEFYRLSFGRAVEKNLLADYRVIVLTVSEAMASQVYQQTMAEEGENGFDVPEVAKILGCWKGLATRGAKSSIKTLYQADLEDGSRQEDYEMIFPMQRAVAFSSTIKESQRLADMFQEVVDAYIEKSGVREPLQVQTQHVDGTMDSTTRKGKLRWLEENPGDDICRVLTNAKCLSEGIDVPSLDAVLFMKPRKSQVDIIQAVGRVMRKAPGKRFGYIILPVVVPAGMSPEEALDDDKAFAVVWQILQALRSHDERLDARINSLQFAGAGDDSREFINVLPFEDEESVQEAMQEKLALEWTVDDWQNAMEAKLVKKCGTRVYWDDWADDVAGIASRHIARINSILQTDEHAASEFKRFLAGLRDSLNPGITDAQAVEMLAQHLITLPVFEALFGNESFAKSNPVSIAMEGMLDVLREKRIENREDDEVLQSLYDSVSSRVSVVQTSAGRQAIIKELYEGFFSKAFKGTSEKMGIVYTPNEIVSYILHATDRMLKAEFGQGLGDPGVHVLDPFAGTGTFMADLIASDLISDEQLPYKYRHELHSNEILLLAYYIMTINIEQAYHQRMGGDYVPFEGAVLTDTFQMTEEGDTLDTQVFTQNSERVVQQNQLDIRVIVGNPPYSAGQKSANDNNANESYPSLDGCIAATYAAGTDATNKNSLYDSYIRAIRWASDRIGDAGIICYVSNAGWVDGQAMDGMRKCLAEEFNAVYVYHLRGNQRTQGEESRREGGKVFGSGSRAPIAITMLVKNPESDEYGKIYFHDIGDYLTREQKLSMVKQAAVTGELAWTEIHPDRHGDWLNQRDDSFYEFAPMGMTKYKAPKGLFVTWSNGNKTQRDSWAVNYSQESLGNNMAGMIEAFNFECDRLAGDAEADKHIDTDPKKISWTRRLQDFVKKGRKLEYKGYERTLCQYRPFCKQWMYYDAELNERTYQQPRLFPFAEGEGEKAERTYQQPMISSMKKGKGGVEMTYQQRPSHCFINLAICLTGGRSFSVQMTKHLADLHYVGDSQCFPLYWYEKVEKPGALSKPSGSQASLFASVEQPALGEAAPDDRVVEYKCHDAITDEALSVFRKAYPNVFGEHGKTHARAKKDGGVELTKEDIFYYIYGILHSPEYRSRFASNLKKELPRIPLAADFRAFSIAGRALADLHLNYETIEPWPLEEVGNSQEPGRTEKIRFGKCKKDDDHPKGEDRTVLCVAENLTLKGIPERAYDYIVNGKSGIGWLMDRYRVTTDKASGIVNDPNEYSDDPRYIVDLVKRVVRVSMETLEIVGSLPPLNEKPQPADWPFAWKASE